MANEAHDRPTLVVIGGSAGGVDALERLISTLDSAFPAPIVIVQNDHDKRAADLQHTLQRISTLPVQWIDEPTELNAGSIYLAREGNFVAIEGERVVPITKKTKNGQAMIGTLFHSAAKSHGEAVVAILLGAGDHDGMSSLRSIKHHGGTVVVQELEDSGVRQDGQSFFDVDFVAPIDSLPGLISSLVGDHSSGSEVHDPELLRAFLAQLRARSGIDFRQYKTPTIARRLYRLMSAARCGTLSEYLRYLSANPEGYQRLVSAFLIKVTGFFRDAPLFSNLREQVLPLIIARSKKNKSELRIWSAGCATGEEAYSIAILLAELLGDEVDDLPIRIFATDLDADAITFARRGVYPSAAFSEMAPELVAKYFTKVDGAYQVKKRIRNLTVFGEYDLGQRAPFPRIDLIFCRNVLIYFTKELQQRTLQLFAFSLNEGGYLVLGKSETTNPLPQYFSTVQPMLKIFRRQGERLLIPAPTFRETAALPERPSVRRRALRTAPHPRRISAEIAPRWSLTERLGSFLFDSPIGVVVVDRNYDILTINQSARTLLNIHGEGIGDDLIHLAAAPGLKNMLDAAFRNELPVNDQEIELLDSATNETRFLQVSCYPDKTHADGRITGVIVLVVDATNSATSRRAVELENAQSREAIARLKLQTDQLLARQRTLVDANNELTAANNDLRSANEHLLIAAEEAESSAEEVETLNEEMQATSEELETLNEELQATVEELNTTNEELGARGLELERIATVHETRAAALQTLVDAYSAALHDEAAPLYIVHQHRILAASQAYLKLQRDNPLLLPSVSDVWRQPSHRLDLSVGNGRIQQFSVSIREMADSLLIVALAPV